MAYNTALNPDWEGRLDANAGEGKLRLFLVEDRGGAMQALADFLVQQPGMSVIGTADSGMLACVRALFERPDVVLVSADLVGFTALDTIRLIKQMSPAATVVLMGRCVEPLRCVRKAEQPDAVIECPICFAGVVSSIRSLRSPAAAAS